jgi:hypothetical protein
MKCIQHRGPDALLVCDRMRSLYAVENKNSVPIMGRVGLWEGITTTSHTGEEAVGGPGAERSRRQEATLDQCPRTNGEE